MSIRMLVLDEWSRYVCALRPWSFSSSFTPVLLGTVLAYKTTGVFSTITFLVTLITVFAVHGAGNLVNTYYDFIRGVDSKKSDDRTLVDRRLLPEQVVRLGMLSYLTGCLGLLLLIYLSPTRSISHMAHLALVFFVGLTGSVMYTCGNYGLKYIALGDVLILIIFGPLSILFAYMVQTGSTDMITMLYAVPLALSTEAILHSNNTRDLEADRRAGLVTIPILIGRTCSHLLFALLLFVPYIMFVFIAVRYSLLYLLPMPTLFWAFRIERDFRTRMLHNVPHRTKKLNILLGLLYIASLIIVEKQKLPFLP